MIPKECKRLAEVDFPIAVVSKHSAREKSIRHGHPSTLHLWWARRPLAACRAMLLALLLPDPCDPHCPEDFKPKARDLLPKVQGKVGQNDKDLRQALLKFIGDFSNWDLSSNQAYLEVGRGLVKAAHPEETPLVVDPFAGGGSIPLEALRLGCEAFASDLNPVACFILKVMLEDVPRHGPELGDELRKVGREIKEAAEKELSDFYPPDPDGSRPIAYLWARAVRCEAPNCGAEIPLIRSFWLCKRANRKLAFRPLPYPLSPAENGKNEGARVEFEIFEPQNEKDVGLGTVNRAKATCPCCGTVLSPDRVRAQLAAMRGGADVIFDDNGGRVGGSRLLAVVTLSPQEPGRHYRLPTMEDYRVVWRSQRRLHSVTKGKQGLVPDEPLPWRHGHRSIGSPRVYGMTEWGDLFTARQKLSLVVLAELIKKNVRLAVAELMTCVLSKLSDKQSSLCGWKTTGEYMGTHTFSRHALPMVWDFCEANLLGTESGSISREIDWVSEVVEMVANIVRTPGSVQMSDACASPLPNQNADVWFTDPPYYDAIPYADLSDFFFVWLKRALPNHPLLRDPFDPSNSLTPKRNELTVTTVIGENSRPKGRDFFESGMELSFTESRRVLLEDGIGSVVFAHKTTEGWEALLSGMIRSGWTITSSWPITTEMGSRLNARETACSLLVSTLFVDRAPPMRLWGIGVTCFENFPNELEIGWSGFNLKVSGERILFLLALVRPLRFLAGTHEWRLLKGVK